MPVDSFRTVLDSWPSLVVIATQLRERYATVHNWYRRDSIPRWYWPALIRSAERLGISGISIARFELLDRLRHAPESRPYRAARRNIVAALRRSRQTEQKREISQ